MNLGTLQLGLVHFSKSAFEPYEIVFKIPVPNLNRLLNVSPIKTLHFFPIMHKTPMNPTPRVTFKSET